MAFYIFCFLLRVFCSVCVCVCVRRGFVKTFSLTAAGRWAPRRVHYSLWFFGAMCSLPLTRGWRCWLEAQACDANAMGTTVEGWVGGDSSSFPHHHLPSQVLLQVQPRSFSWEPCARPVHAWMFTLSLESLLHWDWNLTWSLSPGLFRPCWRSSVSSENVTFTEIPLASGLVPLVPCQHSRRCSFWRLWFGCFLEKNGFPIGAMGEDCHSTIVSPSWWRSPWIFEVGSHAYDSAWLCSKLLCKHYLHVVWSNATVFPWTWGGDPKGKVLRCCSCTVWKLAGMHQQFYSGLTGVYATESAMGTEPRLSRLQL